MSYTKPTAPAGHPAYTATGASTLTQWATASKFDVNTLVTAAGNGEIQKFNELYNVLLNKLVSQGVESFLEFENGFTKAFGYGPENPMVSMREYLITDIMAANDYDADERVATTDALADVFKVIINDEVQKRWDITSSPQQVMAAFTNEQSANAFLSDIMNKFATSVEVYLQDLLGAMLKGALKNTKAAAGSDFTAKAANILETLSDWELPANDGRALGFANGTLPAGKKFHSRTMMSDLVVVGKPSTLKQFSTRLANIYHNGDLKLENFAAVVKSDAFADGEIAFVHKRAFKINRRIERTESQYFARNMKLDTYKHLWLTLGLINVAPGIKFTGVTHA